MLQLVCCPWQFQFGTFILALTCVFISYRWLPFMKHIGTQTLLNAAMEASIQTGSTEIPLHSSKPSLVLFRKKTSMTRAVNKHRWTSGYMRRWRQLRVLSCKQKTVKDSSLLLLHLFLFQPGNLTDLREGTLYPILGIWTAVPISNARCQR